MRPAGNLRFVEFHQPRESREVQYITANGERTYQRHQTERILPSVEVDDFDMKESAHAPHQDVSQKCDASLRDMHVHGRPQYPSRSAADPRDYKAYHNLKRARDYDQAQIVSERPKRPPTYDDRDRVMVVSVDGHAPDENVHLRATESMYDNVPVIVKYDSSTVRLAPRAERDFDSDWRVHPDSHPRQGQHGRSLDLSRGEENVVPRESRRASYTQPAQRTFLPESYRTIDASHSYTFAPERMPAFQPSNTRIVRKETAGDGRFVMHAENSSHHGHYYGKASGVVENDTLPPRESVIYAPSRRAGG